jgi:hypothetical protein
LLVNLKKSHSLTSINLLEFEIWISLISRLTPLTLSHIFKQDQKIRQIISNKFGMHLNEPIHYAYCICLLFCAEQLWYIIVNKILDILCNIQASVHFRNQSLTFLIVESDKRILIMDNCLLIWLSVNALNAIAEGDQTSVLSLNVEFVFIFFWSWLNDLKSILVVSD